MREQCGCKRQRELTKERDIRTGKTKTERIEKTRRKNVGGSQRLRE